MATVTSNATAVVGNGLSLRKRTRIVKRHCCFSSTLAFGRQIAYRQSSFHQNRQRSSPTSLAWPSPSPSPSSTFHAVASSRETPLSRVQVSGFACGQTCRPGNHLSSSVSSCSSSGSSRMRNSIRFCSQRRKKWSVCSSPLHLPRATPGSQSTDELTDNGEDSKSSNKQGKRHLGDEDQHPVEEEEEEEIDSFVQFMFAPFDTEEESGGVLDKIFEEIGNIFKGGDNERTKNLRNVAFWVAAAAAFGVLIGVGEGWNKASEFYAGYLLEQSLSVDNLFVFVLVFNYFQVPVPYQSRVLRYGIAGAVLFRGMMIILGITTLQRFEAVNLVFAAILLFSSFKLLSDSSEGEEDLSNNFIVKACQRFIPVTDFYDEDRFYAVVNGAKKATPLLLTLAVVELSDVAFAVDSIPAVFGVTRDPFIVFTSNMFAVVGLRSLYSLISSSMSELRYLQKSVALVLGFIGCKMIAEYMGEHFPTSLSLAVVVMTLGTGVALSFQEPKDTPDIEWDVFTQIAEDKNADEEESQKK